ncbi:uncharacterized protein LOC115222730 [Argonauta hians]
METCTVEGTCGVLDDSVAVKYTENTSKTNSTTNCCLPSENTTESDQVSKTEAQVTIEGNICNEVTEHGEEDVNPVNNDVSCTADVGLHQPENNEVTSEKEDIETTIPSSPVVGNYITLSDGKTGDVEQTMDSVGIIENNLLNVANETQLSVESIAEKVEAISDIENVSTAIGCKDIILVPVSVAVTTNQNSDPKPASVQDTPEWESANDVVIDCKNNPGNETVTMDIASEGLEVSDNTISAAQDGVDSTVCKNDAKINTNCEDEVTAETLIAISILQNNLDKVNANNQNKEQFKDNDQTNDNNDLNESGTKDTEIVLRKPLTPISVEIGVQANDYEIERRSGKVPARRRVIPYKFRDYRNVDLVEQTNDIDTDYNPTEGNMKAPKKRKLTLPSSSTKRRPGRPRKVCVEKAEKELSPAIPIPPAPPSTTITTTAEIGTETAPEPAPLSSSSSSSAAAVAAAEVTTESLNELIDMAEQSPIVNSEASSAISMVAPQDKLSAAVDAACGKEIEGNISSNKNNFSCKICHREFTQKGNLKVHMRVHTGEKPFQCNFNGCTKRFRNNESLRRHNLIHLGIKPFACEICDNKFSSKISLLEHVAIHTNSKPHVCHICQLPFRQISCLRRHLITHSSDKPFECNQCGQRFSQMVYLKSHSKVHTGEKPFVCDLCNRSFAHQSDVTRHKIIHTGKKPFVCNLCNARFSDPSSKRRHVKEHLGSKPYTCELCGDSFKRAGQLKVHMTRKHSEQEGNYKLVKQDVKSSSQYTYKKKIQAGTVSHVSIDNKPTAYHKKIAQIVEGLTGSEVTHIATPVNSEEVILEETDGQSSQTVAQVVATAMQSAGIGTMSENEQEQFSAICQAASQEHSDNYENSSNQIAATIVEQDLPSLIEDGTDGATVITIVSLEDVEQNPDQACTEHVEVPVEYAQQLIDNAKGDDNQSHFVEVHYEQNESVKQEEIATESSNMVHCEKLEGPIDFVSKPDFSSQEYYDWLSNFTEVCKMMPMPLSPDLFQKISQVHKTLSDVMATPSGVLADKDNFRILMYISSDLHTIICEHLSFVLQNLDNDENTQLQ